MAQKHLKRPPTPSHGSKVPDAPTEALSRPQALKSWSADLVKIVRTQEASVFDDHDFRADSITKMDFTRILKKMTGCGSVVELRSSVSRETGEVGRPAIHAANFCGQHTICPFCAGRVQDRRKARFREPIMAAAGTYKHAYLVTATIPPVPTWREDLNTLLDSWKAFRKMGQIRRRKKKDGSIVESRSGGEWSKVMAGISKVELKRGSGSGLPHCHVHALFFTDEYLDYRVWSSEEIIKPKRLRVPLVRIPVQASRLKFRPSRGATRGGRLPLPWWVAGSKIALEWLGATDGTATGINVQKIKWRPPKRHKGESLKAWEQRDQDWSLADSILEQAREVLKYATKFESTPEAGTEQLFARDFCSIKAATYGRRLFQTYGEFRNVGGDDFIGGACALKENPIIYEARWRTDRYGSLAERSRPVFANCEPGPGLSARLKVLNRIQGATRRTRSAINAAKLDFFSNGNLRPAFVIRREFLEDGGFIDREMALEVPGYLVDAPANPASWERWIDEATEAGRSNYSAARADLDDASHVRIVGTVAERQAEDAIERRAYRYDPTYDELVIKAFREVLAPSSGPP